MNAVHALADRWLLDQDAGNDVLHMLLKLNEREHDGASCAEVGERVREIEAIDPSFQVEYWKQQRAWALVPRQEGRHE